jgi:hypothetical protein
VIALTDQLSTPGRIRRHEPVMNELQLCDDEAVVPDDEAVVPDAD